ncbi:hypothetical protein BJP34_06420 [Moorena producens PAL-8-15-08-1]|uniref:Uncharacterized protein n=1 Tax=Moorena producens PAL-8-15-08-1 TaxID=1458985 RepID=A0A1D8TNI4_9CYAN|nr:tetratricopeptide repeat protein [Moorena producens]AOW99132.1 hypothetical protein BJP34_06420 [Moorena producens PAL-8-15-08-1]
MPSIYSSPIAWLNRPYLDLGPINGGSPHLYKVEFSYRHLISETLPPYQVQVSLPTSFRESVIRETGMTQYQVDHPLQLANELRTERWQKLCDYLTHYQELKPVTKLLVIHLLSSLCLHQTVLEYVPKMSAAEIASDSVLAALAFCRAMSTLILHFDSGKPYSLEEFEIIATHAPSGDRVKINAIHQLVVEYAKTFKDLAKAEFWGSVLIKEIQEIKPSLDDFTYKLLMSIYCRAIVFIPLLHRDKDKVVQEMDRCQSYAESLIGENEEQQIVAYENQNIILESRTKEALWLGDFDLAEERVREAVERDPFDPRYRLELGQVLIKQGRIEEAAKAYRSATKLGPPGTAVAWFMAGQCYQSLGELDMACDCYLAAVDADPLAISPVKRLTGLATHLENSLLANWSQLRLTELQAQKQRILEEGERSFTAEVSFQRKTSREAVTA